MTGWLLDTNIISELRKRRPKPSVDQFVRDLPLNQLFVSDVTLAELRFGIERLTDAQTRADLNDWLTHKVRPMFAKRTLPITEDIMLRWRVLLEAGRKGRFTVTQPDLIIAATALHHGLTVVTRDVGDFERAGCALRNPWEEA